MIGATIGHYKVIKKLGQVGMGIVYQAEDMKLDRIVALKFLPPHLHESETERARFVQEAKSASSLNHPNVCIIHTIDEAVGQQYIVMEYIDGSTLREKFREAPLKVNDALDYTIQIGEALHEAHSKGIVHRDIKADNIMVNSKNQIKVMDFGLAKLKGSLKLTRSSSTVGTLAYMAPEQIQGGTVDARSDIFSFGIVIYEMLTKRTPFRGEHEAAMVYSIVNEEPEPIEKHRDDLPPDLGRILHRAIEKDPEDRYQSIADMISEVKRLRKDTTRVSRASVRYDVPPVIARTTESVPTIQPVKQSRKGLWIGLSIIILVAICAGAVYYFKLLPETTSSGTLTLNPAMTFRVLQVQLTEIGYPGLSPDGNWAAFPAADVNNKWDVYYMNVAGGEPRRITSDSSSSITQVDISPDGASIAYDRWNDKSQQYEVCVVSALGGVTKRVAEIGYRPRWKHEGNTIGFLVNRHPTSSSSGKLEFWTVQSDGSNKQQQFDENLAMTGNLSSFAWSPDGNSIAFLRSYVEGYQEIFLHDLKTSAVKQLTMEGNNIGDLCWSHGGNILFSSEKGGNANVWMMTSSGEDAVQVTKGSGPDISMKSSVDGKKVLYLQQLQTGIIWMADSNGLSVRQLPMGDRGIRYASMSPDGKKLVLEMADIDPLKSTSHIYIMNSDGSSLRQLSSGNEMATHPQWSPDGKWISYVSRTTSEAFEESKIYLVDPMFSETPKMLTRGQSVWWFDSLRVLIRDGVSTYAAYLDGNQREQFYEDSTFAIPILDRDYFLYQDFHRGKEGWWITGAVSHPGEDAESLPLESYYGPLISDEDVDSLNIAPNPWSKRPLFVLSTRVRFVLGPDGKYLLYINSQGELWKVTLPQRQHERLSGSVPGRNSNLSMTKDGTMLIFVESYINAKLVLIENLQ